MSLRYAPFAISLITSTACLSFGYLRAGEWLVIPAMVLAWIVWFAFNKRAEFWSVSIGFVLYVLIAAFGIFTHLSVLLMVSGGFSALVAWDLLLFKRSMTFTDATQTNNRLETNHFKSLSLAVLVGILATLSASLISFQLSFGAVIVFVILATGCLIVGVRLLSNNGE